MYTHRITYEVGNDGISFEGHFDFSFCHAQVEVSYHIRGTDHEGYCSGSDARSDRSAYWVEKDTVENVFVYADKFSLEQLVCPSNDILRNFFEIHKGCTNRFGSGYCSGMEQVKEATDFKLINITIDIETDEEEIDLDNYGTFSYRFIEFKAIDD